MQRESRQIVITGAGPSGAVAGALLKRQGFDVLIIERQMFPRFSIGESLLPQSMEYIEKAGMLQDVIEAGFQYKNGAAFVHGDAYTHFDFRQKFSKGWGTTYQVQRANFDKVLADSAAKQGVEIRYLHEVTEVDLNADKPVVSVRGEDGTSYQVEADFVLDASGFGRILPRLLDLETPSDFPVRGAIFTHIQDNITPNPNPTGNLEQMDRNKIRIIVHPQHHHVWFWLIPFSNGRCSLGVVAKTDFLEQYQGTDLERLQAIVSEDKSLSALLKNAVWDTPGNHITGYSANVKTLWGKGFALLGNAGEFLDPVFSSGVTIAVKSADLAADCITRHYRGEAVNWQTQYADVLRQGVDAFRVFVEAWYQGDFQKIIFYPHPQDYIRDLISSILAGYAWDTQNPLVANPTRRMKAIIEACNM